VNKSLLASVALVTLATSSVFAADMPRKAPAKVPLAYDWTGFYVGANVGWSFGHASTDWAIATVPVGSTSSKLDGILGGFQGGYNWQLSNWVFGIEADFQGTAQKGSSSLTALQVPQPPDTNVGEVKLPWFGTIRGRVGMTPSDRFLVYFTGGAAYGEIATDVTSTTLVGPTTITTTASNNTIHTGWTVGGGVETSLTDNWTAKLEYLYVDLGVVGNIVTGPGSYTPISTNVSVTDHIVRLGVNYRFGGTPLVAKY
jgi:outer membrane immunogenic protein